MVADEAQAEVVKGEATRYRGRGGGGVDVNIHVNIRVDTHVDFHAIGHVGGHVSGRVSGHVVWGDIIRRRARSRRHPPSPSSPNESAAAPRRRARAKSPEDRPVESSPEIDPNALDRRGLTDSDSDPEEEPEPDSGSPARPSPFSNFTSRHVKGPTNRVLSFDNSPRSNEPVPTAAADVRIPTAVRDCAVP